MVGSSRFSKVILAWGTDISAFAASQIERDTIEAYLATDYHVGGEHPLVLRIGEANAALSAFYRSLAIDSASSADGVEPLEYRGGLGNLHSGLSGVFLLA